MKCNCTHALIPEFSLPNTSIGTLEAEKYRELRSENISQVKASKIFTELGFSSDYGISLERKLKIVAKKSKALFADTKDPLHEPFKLSIIIVNKLYQERGYNPLYFSRNNILRIREIKQGFSLPLNKQSYGLSHLGINSS